MQNTTRNWTIGVIILLILIVIVLVNSVWWNGNNFTLGRTSEIHSNIDGLPYRVHLIHEDSSQAADTMAELNRRAIDLMRHLRQKYLRGSTLGAFPEREHATKRLLGLYNPDNLAENSPRDPKGDTSYTIDKGAILALCLREKNPAQSRDPQVHDIHDLEMLMFVTLHELTHIAIEDIDHPLRFWRAFKFILEEAIQYGILQGVDYKRYPTVYCGLVINYNPLYDSTLTLIT